MLNRILLLPGSQGVQSETVGNTVAVGIEEETLLAQQAWSWRVLRGRLGQ